MEKLWKNGLEKLRKNYGKTVLEKLCLEKTIKKRSHSFSQTLSTCDFLRIQTVLCKTMCGSVGVALPKEALAARPLVSEDLGAPVDPLCGKGDFAESLSPFHFSG